MRRTFEGRISVGGVVMVALIASGLYFGAMYIPVLTHKMSVRDVAREQAARMLVDFDDMRIRQQAYEKVLARTGIQIGTSEMLLLREQNPNRCSITIRWTEQVKHLWGKNHVMKMAVTESAQPGAIKMKNAN